MSNIIIISSGRNASGLRRTSCVVAKRPVLAVGFLFLTEAKRTDTNTAETQTQSGQAK